jgi:F0F1-type ATP synthase assembly protein I
MEMSSLVTTIALEMVVPILLGYWIDHRLGSAAVFTILGGVLGMTLGIWHLIKMTGAWGAKAGKDRSRGNDLPPQ